MNNTTTIKVAKKYQGMLETIEKDSDGYWAYSNKGFQFAGMGCHTAHEDTQKDLLAMIRTLEPCECEQCQEEEKNPCSCDDESTKFFQDHGSCEYCFYVGDVETAPEEKSLEPKKINEVFEMPKTLQEIQSELDKCFIGEVKFQSEDEMNLYFDYEKKEQFKVRKSDYALSYRFNDQQQWDYDFDLFLSKGELIMNNTDYYNYEKSKARSVKEDETVDGFEVTYVGDGIVLVDINCKKCGQALRLFEALAYGDLCENCL
jgi:predicted nucleic acid binding AN1-type Zn finger protein